MIILLPTFTFFLFSSFSFPSFYYSLVAILHNLFIKQHLMLAAIQVVERKAKVLTTLERIKRYFSTFDFPWNCTTLSSATINVSIHLSSPETSFSVMGGSSRSARRKNSCALYNMQNAISILGLFTDLDCLRLLHIRNQNYLAMSQQQ